MMYALDSNTISFILRNNEAVTQRWKQEESAGNRAIIPPITFYEVKRGLLAVNATAKLAAFEQLCDVFGVGTLDMETLDSAAEIYARLKNSGKLIDDADLLIGAYCLTHGYTLVTDNTRHFERIKGLQYENWLSA